MDKSDKDIKRSKAVALRYGVEDNVPRVVASGVGEIARGILKLAEDNDIPIKKDDDLVDILSKLDVGENIPEETYRAVAEILAFLYRTDMSWRKKKEREIKDRIARNG